MDLRVWDNEGRIIVCHEEFQCPKTGVVRFHPEFQKRFWELRRAFGQSRELPVISCCLSGRLSDRTKTCPYHAYDRVWPDGSIGTLAIDVRNPGPGRSYELIRLATQSGWSVGFHNDVIHLDYRRAIRVPEHSFGEPPHIFGF